MNTWIWMISAWLRLLFLVIFAVSLGFVLYTPYATLRDLADPASGNSLLPLRPSGELDGSVLAERMAPQFIADPISACGFNLLLLPIQASNPGNDQTGHPLAICPMVADETPVEDSTHLAGRPMVVRVRHAEQALSVYDFTGLRTVVPGLHPLDSNPCPIRTKEELRAEERGLRVRAEMQTEQRCANELIGRLLARVGACAIADWKRRLRSLNEPNCANALAQHESLPWYEQARVEGEIGERAQAILYNALRSRASDIELNLLTRLIYGEIPWLVVMLVSFLLFSLTRLPRLPEASGGGEAPPHANGNSNHGHGHDTSH